MTDKPNMTNIPKITDIPKMTAKKFLCCPFISTLSNNQTPIVNTYNIPEYAGEQERLLDWESNTMHQRTYHLIASLDWQS